MNSFEIIGFATDYRTATLIVYAQVSIDDYLILVGENYDKFKLQRRREQHKGYDRLQSDIQKGALIPSITLALEPIKASSFIETVRTQNREAIKERLIDIKDSLYILDGLQRTHKIKQLQETGTVFNRDQKLLLEIWFEPVIEHLIYRLIVLNSGQKPMSMRHQIELLFATMRVSLSSQIDGLELLVENEEQNRKRAKQFPFERLVTSYKCYLTGSPEVDKDSLVAEKMLEEKILSESEEFLSETFISFRSFLGKYCNLDEELFRICNGTDLNSFRNWFAEANVINSVFAAIKKLGPQRAARAHTAMDQLLNKLRETPGGVDVLNLQDYKIIRESVADPKLYNVGFATRKLLTNSFNEYFKDEGSTTLLECWQMESQNIINEKKEKK